MKFNKNTISIIIALAFIIQLIIITYNHLTGYKVIPGFGMFLFSLVYATLLSSIGAAYFLFTGNRTILLLDKYLAWSSRALIRIPVEIVFVIIHAGLPTVLITLIAHILHPYNEGLEQNIINNILISSVINIMVTIALEAYLFYRRLKIAQDNAIKLERENALNKLESLKNQLNPHFLFNSLNVLSSLIRIDKDLADKFLTDFSKIYRYILDTVELPVVELKTEIDFCIKYLNLQKYRFGEGIAFYFEEIIDIDRFFIPPLAVQLAIENAIKHNSFDKSTPLKIEVYSTPEFLIVANNFCPKQNPLNSTGLGIKNLKRRYSILSDVEPVFYLENNKYFAKLPLIYGE